MAADRVGAERTARHEPSQAPRVPLSRESIVRAALALVDREGLPALSMRRLGAELGVDPMAVYYHVSNKEALLDAIVEAVMADIDLAVDDRGAAPEDRIMCAARAYRDAMLAHPEALPIVLSRGPRTPGAMRPVELLLAILRDAGLSPTQAMAGMNAIAATVRGTVSMIADGLDQDLSPEGYQQLAKQFPVEEFPNLSEAAACNPDFIGEDFDFGIRALARGLIGSAGTGQGA
jgi:TetR/AcrR family transcriptional regulator, tetracycline repressor protein